MKFYTPEWYNDTVVSEMYAQMRKTQSASKYSDKFYEKLRKIELRAFKYHAKRTAKIMRQKFDAQAAEQQFNANYEENLAFVKANLPDEILQNVKDIRVLALGSADYEVTAQIERFCAKMMKKCRNIESQYEEQLEIVAQSVGWETVNSLDLLIGSPIESVVNHGNKVVVTTSAELVGVSYKITLSGVSDESVPQNAQSAIIHRPELVANGDKLGFGILCFDEESKPLTVEFCAENISIANA